ncbi:hypothetical protein EDB89DRAFT_149114 [Lactarius sanguifluus]|nr:hypothetical protein EDB89DRAFT_149114 [Lactarius sanguifluus]
MTTPHDLLLLPSPRPAVLARGMGTPITLNPLEAKTLVGEYTLVNTPTEWHSTRTPHHHQCSHSRAIHRALHPGRHLAGINLRGRWLRLNSSSSSVIPSGMVTLEPSSARYACSYCGRGFTRPSSLRIHVHSHTGERPFKCTFDGCNRTFSVQSNMRRHARTHLQSGNEARESEEGEDEGEEGSPQPPVTQADSAAPPR